MRFTLPQIRRWTEKALADQGIPASVLDCKWLGQRCKYRDGSGEYRIARVRIKLADGSVFPKLATLHSDGGFDIR